MTLSFRSWLAIATVAIAGVAGSLSPAQAAEPRPWLCRDKPVFSSKEEVQYEVSSQGGTRWQMFFMQLDPNGPHDGYTTINSAQVSPHGSRNGTLPAGQYFAVPLYSREGHWICPDYDHDQSFGKSGVVADICYGAAGPPCTLKLTVRPSLPPGVEPIPKP